MKDHHQNNPSKELVIRMTAQRTALALQRSRLSADRTLMAVIRTSLSLIAFGFTIFQFFHSMKKIHNFSFEREPLFFGLLYTGLGVGTITTGIIYHIHFMMQIRKERNKLKEDGLLPAIDTFPVSMTLIIANLLLIIGISAVVTMLVQIKKGIN